MWCEVAEAAEEIIRETCKELDIEVIDMAVRVDHVHLFIKYLWKESQPKQFDQRDVYANHVRIYRQIGRIYEPSSDIKR
ncbi:hypothetical protein DRN97_06675 [Methanosarcinales archaeon]|nr:MAG: hypothetical protein DRN97_06675 [Methanosarcinales archaeon]